MEQVTIVVPFYNVQAYIGICLDSLIVQTHKNIEILCIDDCSIDGSSAIIESYAANDDRIKIIRHEENRGLGGARNTGIKYASGKYICFVDSDDYVSDRFVELLCQGIVNEESDVVVCNIMSDEDGVIRPYGDNYENDSFIIADNKENVLGVAMRFNPGCANKMYKRELLVLNKINQPEKCYYEDVVFWLKAAYHSCKISSIPDRIYYYRQRSGSIMNTLTYQHIEDRFVFIREIDGFVKENILPALEVNKQKVLDDCLIYILRHLRHGKMLIDEACVENKVEMIEYYDNEIIRFSIDFNWPALPAAYNRWQYILH